MSPPSRPLPPKKDVAEALLKGPSLYVHLDPRKADVVVPLYFKKQPQLVLQVGLNMAIAIPDLKVDDEGVTCTLSFNRKPFWCRLPWTAVFALVGEDMKGMVWPDEVPAEVAAQRDAKPTPAAPETKTARPRAARESRRRTQPEATTPSKKLAVVRDPTSVPPVPAQPNLPFPSAAQSSPPGGQRTANSPRDAETQPTVPNRESNGKPAKRELPPYLRVVK